MSKPFPWLLILLIVGCGLKPQSIPAPGLRQAILSILPSGRQIHSLSHRWQATDVFQYQVTLKKWNGTEFADFVPPLVEVVPKQANTWIKFIDLRPGAKYQAMVVAQGSRGGMAPDLDLNTQTPCVATFDFSGDQDLENTFQQSVTATLDPVTFASTLRIQPQNQPALTSSFALELKNLDNGIIPFMANYPSSQSMVLDSLRVGVHYQITLKARNASGGQIAQAISPFYFDPAGQDLPDATVSLMF